MEISFSSDNRGFPAAYAGGCGISPGGNDSPGDLFLSTSLESLPGMTMKALLLKKVQADQDLKSAEDLSISQAAGTLLKESPPHPERLWECRIESSLNAPPAIDSEGTAYVGSYDNHLHAIKDGHEIWSFKTGDRISYHPRIAPDGKTVIFGSDDKKIYAVKDGVKLWEYEAGDALPMPSCIGPDGTVYLGNHQGKTYAVKEGKRLWEFSGLPYSFPGCAGPDGTAYVGHCGKNLFALKDGKVAWKYEAGGAVGSPSVSPDGTVYVSIGQKKLHAIRDGKKIWECDVTSHISTQPIIGPDGLVFVQGPDDPPDNKITAIRNGRVLWEYGAENAGDSHATAGPDGSLYVANYFMKILVLKDGKKVQELKTDDILLNAAAVGNDGTVYSLSGIGNLVAFRSPDSPLLERMSISPSEPGPVITDEDQWILIDNLRLRKRQ